jgi:hypothetical protein
MLNTRTLLMVTALLELATGAALLIVPALTAVLLLGEALTSSAALVVARVAGIALISIAIACWMARNDNRQAQSGQVAGMLIYNFAVPIVLIHGWFASGFEGFGLWPASVLHALLAIWCVVCLRPIRG